MSESPLTGSVAQGSRACSQLTSTTAGPCRAGPRPGSSSLGSVPPHHPARGWAARSGVQWAPAAQTSGAT